MGWLRRNTLAMLCVVFLCALSHGARAETLRAAVRAPDKADRAFLLRLKSQVSDLDVEVVEAATPHIEPQLDSQLESAALISKGARCEVVVWLDHGKNTETSWLLVAQPARGRVLVRTLPAGARREDGTLTSAGLETAALMTRTSLRAIAMGGEIGVEVPHVRVAPDGAPVPTAFESARVPKHPGGDAQSQSEESRGKGTPSERTHHRILIAAGYQASVNGHTEFGLHGLAVQVAWLPRSDLGVGLEASTSYPGEMRDEFTAVSVSRMDLAARATTWLRLSKGVQLTGGVRGGASAFRRTTTALRNDVRARAASNNVTPLFGADAGIEIAPAQRAPNLAGWLGIGADWLPGAPTFVYQVREGSLPDRALWQLQPRAFFLLTGRLR